MLIAAVLACASAPQVDDPSQSGVWGTLRLLPRADLPAHDPVFGKSAYDDPRYADAELVDYSRAGFAVVYVDGPPPPGGPLVLEVRAGLDGLRLAPAEAVVAVGGQVVLNNHTDEPRVLSAPAANLLRRLAPGESVSFTAREAGELDVFVPDAPQAQAKLFAAPGPFARVESSGHYALLGLAPGPAELRVWHARFAPIARAIELPAGRALHLDLELGPGSHAEHGDGG